MTLSEFLKDSNYKLTQFSTEKIKAFEESIILRENEPLRAAVVCDISRTVRIEAECSVRCDARRDASA